MQNDNTPATQSKTLPPTVQEVYSPTSPFDSIRRVRADGSEYWSARDLMTLMEYSTWQKMMVPINRAMQAARNQNMDLTSHFNRSVKTPEGGGPGREDFELSRFAAYLVSLNGDPNKSEVAAAQAYFVTQTRAAEVKIPLLEASSAYALEAGELFERYKQVHPDGWEFCSGRDLMKPLGYEEWTPLKTKIHLALRRANALGLRTGREFQEYQLGRQAGDIGRPRKDYRLGRTGVIHLVEVLHLPGISDSRPVPKVSVPAKVAPPTTNSASNLESTESFRKVTEQLSVAKAMLSTGIWTPERFTEETERIAQRAMEFARS